MRRLNSKQLRVTKPEEGELAKIKRNPVYIVLDNVLDTYNIGAIFRLAEATAASEMILCAGAETPPSSRIHKAAVGTEEWVPWSYETSSNKAIERLRKIVPGIKIIAVEQDPRAVSLFEFKHSIFMDGPAAIIVGHETDGVAQEAMEAADVIVELPMWGVNKSLNVMVSTGIVLYRLLEK